MEIVFYGLIAGIIVLITIGSILFAYHKVLKDRDNGARMPLKNGDISTKEIEDELILCNNSSLEGITVFMPSTDLD